MKPSWRAMLRNVYLWAFPYSASDAGVPGFARDRITPEADEAAEHARAIHAVRRSLRDPAHRESTSG